LVAIVVVVVVAAGSTTVVTVVLLDELVLDDVLDEVVVDPAVVEVVGATAPPTVNPVVASCPLGLWAWMVADPGSEQLVFVGAVHADGILTALAFDPLATAITTGGRVPCSNLT
jgi:hypothetical protein